MPPDILDTILKPLGLVDISYPDGSIRRIFPDEVVMPSLERKPKIPHWAEDKLCIFLSMLSLLMDETTATKRFCIIYNLPYNIIACQCIYVNIVFPSTTGLVR